MTKLRAFLHAFAGQCRSYWRWTGQPAVGAWAETLAALVWLDAALGLTVTGHRDWAVLPLVLLVASLVNAVRLAVKARPPRHGDLMAP